MKLPPDVIIAQEKLTQYLLVPQTRNDKSAFLELAGYHLGNADVLLRDLRKQILPLEATDERENQFGKYHEITGPLRGPNDFVLQVRTIWMTEHLSGETKFVTLIPDRR